MATDRGALRRENADMSNDKPGEIPGRRKPRQICVGDGQQVNIPALATLKLD